MAVEIILSIDDKEKREKLNKFAKQALDRAEELKGINKSQDPVDPEKKSVPFENRANTSKISPIASKNITIPKHSPKLEVVANEFGYSMEEKKVLEKTSLINSRIYVPFMDHVDTKEKFNFPIPFSDKDGLLELAPKQRKEFQEWIRISDLCENPSIISGPYPDFYSIKQTVVSDCSFVSSLTVAALYEKRFNKRILTSIIYPRNSKDEPIYNPSGKYSVKLYVNGIARKVVVDDFLPVGR
jgi:calpain-7